MNITSPRILLSGVLLCLPLLTHAADPALVPLFPQDGPVTKGWVIGDWFDVKNAPKHKTVWEVRDGTLMGGKSPSGEWVGTWLLSEQEYSDFILDVEFKFKKDGARGNGGISLRGKLTGDPAYEGFELQITDPRYEASIYPNPSPEQLTGALYLVKAPAKQMYKQGEWNHYRAELRGPLIKVWLNDVLIQDVDTRTLTADARRHGEGNSYLPATPGAKRPPRGHIGFQDLSEDGEMLMFRNPRIAVLN